MATAPTASGWPALFRDAFRRSSNPMALTDGRRVVVDANNAFVQLLGRPRASLIGHPIWAVIKDGPLATPSEWADAMKRDEIVAVVDLLRADGSPVTVQFAAYPELVTGRQLVLFVTLNVSRWGSHFRREPNIAGGAGDLSDREREVVRLIALGASGPEIAEELKISHNTVRSHAQNAMERVGARSRAHLVAIVLGAGLTLDQMREMVQQ